MTAKVLGVRQKVLGKKDLGIFRVVKGIVT